MIEQQTLQGNWNELKGLLRSKWGSLTDDDLAVFNGNVDQLVGTIQRITGEARDGIEQFLEQVTADGAAAIRRTGETVRAGTQTAVDAVQATSHKAAGAMRDTYAEAEQMVVRSPAKSLAVCFGVGVITGAIVGLLLRRR